MRGGGGSQIGKDFGKVYIGQISDGESWLLIDTFVYSGRGRRSRKVRIVECLRRQSRFTVRRRGEKRSCVRHLTQCRQSSVIMDIRACSQGVAQSFKKRHR